MGIDIRTIILITGISHFMQILVFSYQYKANKNVLGPGWWLLWSGAESLGFLIILLRPIPSFLPFAIALADPIIMSGAVFIYIGLMKFFNKKANFRIIIIFISSFVILHLFFFFIIDDIFIRTLLLNIYLSFIGFYTAFIIFKHKTRSINSTAVFNIILFVIHGSIFSYRTIELISGVPFEDVFSPNLFNATQYFDALMIGLLWTFGLIIMLNQKLNSEISEAMNHFEQIFNLSPDAVIISRLSDGILVNCNEGFTAISGYKKENILGRSSLENNLWKNPEDRQVVYTTTAEKGFCNNYEALFQKENNELVLGLISTKIITLHDTPHIISVIRDITGHKQAEEEIKSKNNELLKLNSEKEKFFSIIAHDLKSPFQGLIGYSEILSQEYHTLSEEEIISYIHSIEELSHSSYRLLANLLEWTRMQTGQMSFNPDNFDLRVELHSTLSLLKHTAQNKNIEFNYIIDNLLFVKADKNMLSTIIRNLVSNSIKFTNKGGRVTLTAKKTDEAVEFSVSDTGIGIEKENIGKLFSIDKNVSKRGYC